MKTESRIAAKISARTTSPESSLLKNKNRGFALVVTLSLMILLTIIAVGLLSLSSVSLRSSSQGSAMAEARANARLALMMALGDLQKHAGPDQRITAPAGTLGTSVARPNVTGIWESRAQGPQSKASDFEASDKATKFKRWLVSTPNSKDLDSSGFASAALSPGATVIDLVSAKQSANPASAVPALNVTKVPVTNLSASNTQPRGRYAYAVLDEGVKARVNIGTSKPTNQQLANASSALGSGQRPNVDRIEGIPKIPAESLDLDTENGKLFVDRMVTLSTSELAYGTAPSFMKGKVHDLTTSSLGLVVDVAKGGFKKDFSLLAQASRDGLPAEYKGRKIYEQSFAGSSLTSDPSWERALGFANIFNGKTGAGAPIITKGVAAGTGSATGSGAVGIPTINATIPKGWVAGTGRIGSGSNAGPATLSNVDPPGPLLLPSIAKIQISFALAARDVYDYPTGTDPKTTAGGWTDTAGKRALHVPWDKHFQNNLSTQKPFKNDANYLLHLVYSPVITLHNPYNLPLTFNKLRVEFVNVPFSFKVTKNGIPQTKELVPFSIMYFNGGKMAAGDSKRFGITLSSSKSADRPVTMLPGEVLVFSPSIDPAQTWVNEVRGTKQFWDWGNRNSEDGRAGGGTDTDTSSARGIPGWNGARVGYDLDFLYPFTIPKYTVPNGQNEVLPEGSIYRWGGIPLQGGDRVLGKKPDRIFVEFAPLPDPELKNNKFSVEMTLNYGPKNLARASVLEFDYGIEKGLQSKLMPNHPQVGPDKQTIRWPEGSDTVTSEQLYDHSSVQLRNNAGTQGFALFSVYAKNTSGGIDPQGGEGLWKGKPYTFQSQGAPAISQNILKTHPSHFSHEIDLSRFPTAGVPVQAETNRGSFVTGFSGTANVGRRFGVIHEVPLSPLQSFSALNGALLASGTQLPHFSSPIANSYAHPLISLDQIVESGPSGYSLTDHCFLLNAALLDSYYFSGVQTRGSVESDGKTSQELIKGFLSSTKAGNLNPLTDRRLIPYIPAEKAQADLESELNGAEGYKNIAANQLVEGAFNVNSISVDAWKAVLAAMPGEKAMALIAPTNDSSKDYSLSKQSLDMANTGARFSRTRLPNGAPDRLSPDGFWRGSIDLDSAQLDSLAKAIVQEVRKRGPFLSLSEFVNRQIGGSNAASGTLQAAIDSTSINKAISDTAKAGISIKEADAASYEMRNPKALEGESSQGAPGYLMQQDLIAVLGNAATVRSDTFTIRAYGESLDAAGKNVLATAYCEAVVQRMPEYVDSADKATTSPPTAKSNIDFGRRFNIVSFKWLSKEEI